MIDVESLTIDYGLADRAVQAVERVDFRLEEGRSLALIGPSGCGKTSILFALAGLLSPSNGTIKIGGGPVTGPRREVALILQNAGLLPWKTVWQNANLSLLLAGDYPEHNAGVILDDLGLTEVKSRFPAELSEGMKRRVGIARALSTAPSVLLMDEPLASLDTLTRERIQDLFLTLWQEHRFSLILVTHDIVEAAFLGQEIIVLTKRPAQVKATVINPKMGSLDYRQSEAFQGRSTTYGRRSNDETQNHLYRGHHCPGFKEHPALCEKPGDEPGDHLHREHRHPPFFVGDSEPRGERDQPFPAPSRPL